tara:strand:- start:763 stop:915 length:153 start_codon:yes stop_codon:yes gene_type:complete
MLDLIASIPWKGSPSQITTLTGLLAILGYAVFVVIGKKDTSQNPRKSFWR